MKGLKGRVDVEKCRIATRTPLSSCYLIGSRDEGETRAQQRIDLRSLPPGVKGFRMREFLMHSVHFIKREACVTSIEKNYSYSFVRCTPHEFSHEHEERLMRRCRDSVDLSRLLSL